MSDLEEELAAALSERLRPRSGMSVRAVMRLAEHILPVVERRVAEAWDDGYRAGIVTGAEDPGRADALAADGTVPHPAHRHDATEAGR